MNNDTKAAIRKQFMKIYEGKEFSRITVREICASVPVARTTFYSYYNNTDEVRKEIEDILIRGIMEVAEDVSGGNLPGMDFTDFLSEIEKYLTDHWDNFYAFLILQPNQRFISKWKDGIKRNFSRRYPDKQRISNYELISEVIASAVIGAYSYWMKNPEMVRSREIKSLISRTLDAVMPVL